MPRVIFTDGVVPGMERCRLFLAGKSPSAAKRAGAAIKKRLQILTIAPDIGRPFRGRLDVREFIIPFGASGYMVLYRHVPQEDAVYLLAFRHLKEEGYREPVALPEPS